MFIIIINIKMSLNTTINKTAMEKINQLEIRLLHRQYENTSNKRELTEMEEHRKRILFFNMRVNTFIKNIHNTGYGKREYCCKYQEKSSSWFWDDENDKHFCYRCAWKEYIDLCKKHNHKNIFSN